MCLCCVSNIVIKCSVGVGYVDFHRFSAPALVVMLTLRFNTPFYYVKNLSYLLESLSVIPRRDVCKKCLCPPSDASYTVSSAR